MGRLKGSKNKIRQNLLYPRKCEFCGIFLDNIGKYHYHKNRHIDDVSIEGKICRFKCGNPAKFVNASKQFCCSKLYIDCIGYIKQHSERIKEHWKRPDAKKRKTQTSISLKERLHKQETWDKISKTRREKFGLTEKQRTIYKHYAAACRRIAQRWAKKNNYVLGQQTYHVDHIFSVMDGFRNSLPLQFVNHSINLRILEAKKNSSKGPKSELTIYQLLEKINEYENLNREK
jgi:hypothetical protein